MCSSMLAGMRDNSGYRRGRLVFPLAVVCALIALSGRTEAADENDKRLAAGLQDNSFLIEEAYNQEPGVVQHTAILRRQNRDWFFNFTQEWPLGSQSHQFSYSIPYSWLRLDGQRVHGVGDVMLNYRWQALFESNSNPAFAPRLSLILPTGNPNKELGMGSLGYQVLLPFSKIVSDRVTLHANAGLTSYFDVNGRRPTSYLLGGSAIYAVTRDFNLMLEALGEWTESVNPAREIERLASAETEPERMAFDRNERGLALERQPGVPHAVRARALHFKKLCSNDR